MVTKLSLNIDIVASIVGLYVLLAQIKNIIDNIKITHMNIGII